MSASKVAGLGLACVLVLGAASCSATPAGHAGSGGDGQAQLVRSIRAPLDASLTTTSGAWVDVAMGNTSETADTFWQLMVEPVGATRWALVTPPGFADNGGLMSAQVGATFVTGFGSSALIHFSPLSSTTDAGSNWAPGVVDHALTPVPDALAGSATGEAAALTGDSGTAVLSSSGGLSTWNTVATQKALATSTAGRSCEPTALTALSSVPGGGLLAGATCGKTGEVGVFAVSAGTFRHDFPALSAGEANGATTVLRLRGWAGGVTALVEARSAQRSVLLGATLGTNAAWSTPVALPLTATEKIESSGVSSDGGLVVLLSDGGHQAVDELPAGSVSWDPLPAPPAGTAVVAMVTAAETDAVIVHGAQLRVFRLDGADNDWQMTQVIKVPIQYGSSS